jgi:hypothetical protein
VRTGAGYRDQAKAIAQPAGTPAAIAAAQMHERRKRFAIQALAKGASSRVTCSASNCARHGSAQAQPVREMIVAVWNMAKRPAAWGHLLEGLAPDLALLQETPPPGINRLLLSCCMTRLREQLPRISDRSRDGAARPLKLHAEHRVWFMAAEVQLEGAPPLVAVSVHMPTVPSVRPFVDEAFEELAPLLGDRLFIVGGDFNLSRNYDKVYGTTHHTPSFSTAFPPGASSTDTCAALASLSESDAARTVARLRDTLAAHYTDDRGVALDSRSWFITARRRG